MNELIHIGNSDISIKEYKGQRVVTLKDVDMVHERPGGTAKRNFNTNKKRFIEGVDFFLVSSDEIRTSHIFPISDNDYMDKILLTEQGYLMLVKSFTDDLAWDVQRQLVNGYFKVRKLANDLSPQLQLFQQMFEAVAEQERTAREAKELAERAIETTDNIKEAVKPIFDNWRDEMRLKFNRIQRSTDKQFNILRNDMYSELESRASCDLNARLRNMRERMSDKGYKKSDINKLNKMDVIEQDKKLREIFSKIVTEYEIKYCA